MTAAKQRYFFLSGSATIRSRCCADLGGESSRATVDMARTMLTGQPVVMMHNATVPRASQTNRLTCPTSAMFLWRIGILACSLIIFSGNVEAADVKGHHDSEMCSCDRQFRFSNVKSGSISTFKQGLKWMDNYDSGCSKLNRIFCLINESPDLARLRGGGETSKLSRSTPKIERSAKKRRHRSAFHHSEHGSEEEADSSIHAERTYRYSKFYMQEIDVV
jgi:hypothetical protein